MSNKFSAGVPPLSERQKPGLSVTLSAHPRRPDTCQGCGVTADPTDGIALRVYLECDEWDRPTAPAVLVVLCPECDARHIDAHPRLYKRLDPSAPNLGVMGLCMACDHRDGVRCTNSLSKGNGGPGMEVRYIREPVIAFVRCSPPSQSGRRVLFPGPPVSCAGRTIAGKLEPRES